jgi:hypothetical protein
MTLIAHTELGSAQSSIAFNSIPQTFTDLVLKLSLRTTRADSEDTVRLQFNGVTTAYSGRALRKDNANNTPSITLSDSNLILYQNTANLTANAFSIAEAYISNYRIAAAKSISIETMQETSGGAWGAIVAALWNNTAAITSITLLPNVGPNFAQFSSATLYGITAGSSGGVVVS